MIVRVLLLEIQEWRKLESASCLCGVLLLYNLCTTILVKLGEAGDYECPAGMSVEDVPAVVYIKTLKRRLRTSSRPGGSWVWGGV